MTAISLFANGFVDFDLPGPGSIYTGLGLGGTHVDADGAGTSESDLLSGMQLMAGYEHEVSESAAVYGGVRYRQYFDDFSADFVGAGISADDLSGFGFEFGLKLTF